MSPAVTTVDDLHPCLTTMYVPFLRSCTMPNVTVPMYLATRSRSFSSRMRKTTAPPLSTGPSSDVITARMACVRLTCIPDPPVLVHQAARERLRGPAHRRFQPRHSPQRLQESLRIFLRRHDGHHHFPRPAVPPDEGCEVGFIDFFGNPHQRRGVVGDGL